MSLKATPLLTVMLVTSFILTGCVKDVTVPVEIPEPVITRPVLFSADLVPVFNAKCNTGGCHNTGSVNPDLSAGKAYDALKNGNYTNTANPEASELYLWMKGMRRTPMPLSGPIPADNALVIAWIKQGALNN